MRENSSSNELEVMQIDSMKPISKNDPNYLDLRIYFFGRPDSLVLAISKKCLVGEIITRLLFLAEKDKEVELLLLKDISPLLRNNYQDITLYEMRLLDDDDESIHSYRPLYDMGAMDNEKPIGHFLTSGVALCRSPKYNKIIKRMMKGILLTR